MHVNVIKFRMIDQRIIIISGDQSKYILTIILAVNSSKILHIKK